MDRPRSARSRGNVVKTRTLTAFPRERFHRMVNGHARRPPGASSPSPADDFIGSPTAGDSSFCDTAHMWDDAASVAALVHDVQNVWGLTRRRHVDFGRVTTGR